MITKEQYLNSLKKEFEIIKHLAEKITLPQLDHKPTDGQRTLHELMHYLSYIFIASTESIVTKDMSSFKKYSEETPLPTLENFGEMMDKQISSMTPLINNLTEEELNEEVNMWSVQTRAMHLLNGPLKWAVAYKMQMFLYLKQSGTANIGTINLWAGMDTPPKQ